MDRCTVGCPFDMPCYGCACHVPKVHVPAYPAVEDIPVGLWPSIEEPKASRYKEKKYIQLSLEL